MRKPGSASQGSDRRGGFDYRKDEINQTHEKVIRTLESCNLIGKLGT
ncbi:unnamed protein product [Brassica oleracea]|uniref:(rape) hypothetical protein n=1 Tax=Brassica napus TaxID=3708 RepID=A0A816TZ74_BRANA|nr:unnamed protein product [Brassica napus]